ncbi:MAG: hypothetical protein H6838_09715 [Planctomycetes bacterium]|nr:hypothetical protein [Planctomycetota bacterium]MCB9885759.1 hypothetical protein [Planctomycetota bacterium]
MSRSLTCPFLLACTAALPAQMSGSYSLDPSNPAAFATFTQAVAALFANGVSGPVEIVVAPGSYTESTLIPPITGASATNTITFRAQQGPGSVMLHGSGGDTIALLGVAFAYNRAVRFDGLDFVGAPGRAISATRYVEDVEIRDCTFGPGHVGSAPGVYYDAVIASDNVGNEVGWHIHHNRFTLAPAVLTTSHGIYVANGGGWHIHHNEFTMNGANHALYMENNGATLDRIHDNLFTGALAMNFSNTVSSVAVLRLDSANYNNDIVHNTFAVDIPGEGCCIVTGGYFSGGQPVQNRIYGNVFEVRGQGCAIVRNVSGFGPNPFLADGNLYDTASGVLNRLGSTITTSVPYPTLAAWQAATTQDLNSLQTSPLLQDPFGTPPDLRPTTNSPVRDLAVNTPSYIAEDFGGRMRDAMPDAGAYESTSLAFYGVGCPGTGFQVPRFSNTGSVAIGSTNLTLELSRVPGGALAILLGGLSRTQSAAGPLPYDLGGGCRILAAPEAMISFVASPLGQVSMPYPIPPIPGLTGLDLFFQWAVLDAGSFSPLGVTVSGAAALQL